jgi:coenzyme Q-binding protein COQ10
MFDLVADIDSYTDFLPWCVASRVFERPSDDQLMADLTVGYKSLSETFTSQVTLNRPTEIIVDYVDGPLKYLKNHWTFTPAGPGGNHCRIDFYLTFEFKSKFLQKMMGIFFHEAVKRMVRAFEKRAHEIYSKNRD